MAQNTEYQGNFFYMIVIVLKVIEVVLSFTLVSLLLRRLFIHIIKSLKFS